MYESFPIVDHACYHLSRSELEYADDTAAKSIAIKPKLATNSLFSDLRVTDFVSAPSLHIDDLSEIHKVRAEDNSFFQERGRIRANNGDSLATSWGGDDGYETYCRDYLDLGKVKRVTLDDNVAPQIGVQKRLAEFLWRNRDTRHHLIREIKDNGLRYLHPHMGTTAIWNLALLLSHSSHRPVQVIAPTPEVSRYANDKGEFTQLLKRMFGKNATPLSYVVWNTAKAAKQMKELAGISRSIAVKIPNAAGGEGNLVFDMKTLRKLSLQKLRCLIMKDLTNLEYQEGQKLLITTWLENIIANPSAQLWLPPSLCQPPVLEGLFLQCIEGHNGRFTGCSPADIPESLGTLITRRCLQLGRVYQRLGYVGRCSFDMILTGSDLESSEIKFIECNGRWGGTSLPMTLMNRIFGDWRNQSFETRMIKIHRLSELDFPTVVRSLGDSVYDRRKMTGDLIFLNPRRMLLRDEMVLLILKRTRFDENHDRVGEISHDLTKLVMDRDVATCLHRGSNTSPN